MEEIISIIIPAFNAGQTLSKALHSLRQQHFQSFELIILDNMSVDNTIERAKEFQNFFAGRMIIISESDDGIYDAMNKGIKRSKGQWLYFLGADDYLYDAMVLQDVFEAIKGHYEASFIYGDVVFKSKPLIYDGEFTLQKLLFEKNICHQAIFYHRTVFDLVGDYNPAYKMWADWDLNIRLFRHNKLGKQYIDRKIAIYNDLSGFSSEWDPVFKNELPVVMKMEFQNTLTKIKNQPSYKIGKKLFGWLDKI